MSRIFISHAGKNNAEAVAVRDWLIQNGWNDIFLDLDPERGLIGGQRWQAELKAAIDHCQLVIFLVSPDWAVSTWSKAEFLLAKHGSRPKAILPIIVAPVRLSALPAEMTADYQIVDLTAGSRSVTLPATLPLGEKTTVAFSEEGLQRFKISIERTGLDPKYFAWPPADDPNRSPFRGLKPLEADDAGIFFGREGPVIGALDTLRVMREAAPPRMLVILGASGAGKSSFLRAGLLPRLQRDDQHFLPLPIIRPERAALYGETGLLASLVGAFATAQMATTRSDLRAAIQGGASMLTPLLLALSEKAAQVKRVSEIKPRLPTLVLAIDQAEEFFLAEAKSEADPFLALLRDLVVADAPSIIALFTIRSDNYEQLQEAETLKELAKTPFDLGAMARGSYTDVIKGPARRLDGTPRALEIEEPLADALLSDIEAGGAKDALPLLAFTLERLYDEFHAGGQLRLEHYNQLGRVQGSIEAAVERAHEAADTVPAIPRDRTARLALLRRGLIPWLAGIDPDTGAPRRRVARLSEVPAEARPLIDLLVDQRLLSTDVAKDTKEKTIEPAHEALLRQWGLLKGWLDDDFEVLATLEGVKRAARDWGANAQQEDWLAHANQRLQQAEKLLSRADLAAHLEPMDRSYLAACQAAEDARLSRARRTRSIVFGLVILFGVVGLVAGAAGIALENRLTFEVLSAEAEQGLERANVLGRQGRCSCATPAIRRGAGSVPIGIRGSGPPGASIADQWRLANVVRQGIRLARRCLQGPGSHR